MQSQADIYRNAIMRLNPAVTAEEWAYFESGFACQALRKGQFFIESGKKNYLLGFVTSGLLRGYYVDEKGEDITTALVKENEWAADYPSLLTTMPSRYNFQALEPAIVITVPFLHIQNGYDKFIGFERNGRLIAEEVLKNQQKRIESFQFDNAEQRYLNFVKENPGLFNRISLTHLSSYLGVERPSLSRIRKKIVGF